MKRNYILSLCCDLSSSLLYSRRRRFFCRRSVLGRSETMTQPTMAARQRHRFSAFQLWIGKENNTW